jgi:AcrR family transcriptional regulator
MPTPTRLLRAIVDNLPGRSRTLSEKQQARREEILAAALGIMVKHGRSGLTMAGFATALRSSPATIRRIFFDLDSILAELLNRHLLAIFAAIGQVPEDAPARKTALRAAYLKTTRTGQGALADAHRLLLRERHTLPPDLAAPLEQAIKSLGEILAGANADAALALLDTPSLQAPQIEAMLAGLNPKAVEPQAPIRPKPAPQPDFDTLIGACRRDLLATAASAHLPWPRAASP